MHNMFYNGHAYTYTLLSGMCVHDGQMYKKTPLRVLIWNKEHHKQQSNMAEIKSEIEKRLSIKTPTPQLKNTHGDASGVAKLVL